MGPTEMHVKLRWPHGESKFATAAPIAFASRRAGKYHFAAQVFCQKLARAEKSTSSFAAPLTELKISRVAAAEGSGTPN